MKAKTALGIWTATLAILAMGVPGSAHPGATSHIDSLATSVSGSTLAVSGVATFADVPVTVATDATGDATVSMVGVDLASARIARPDPTRNELKVTLSIADAIPTLFGVPEVVHYSFFFGVGPEGGTAQYLLQALRMANANQPGGNPMFRLLRFNGTSCCTPVTFVSGTMDSGAITWTLPLSGIGGGAGTLITAHPVATRTIQVQLGASGVQWLNSAQPDFMSIDTEYTVPGATVQLGIAPAGTPATEVPLTGTAAISGGNFSGSLPTPAPGNYVVVAKACFGEQSCGLSSVDITV